MKFHWEKKALDWHGSPWN